MRKNTILFILLITPALLLKGQDDPGQLIPSELAALNKALATDTLFAQVTKEFGAPVTLYKNYKSRFFESDSVWQKNQGSLATLQNIGKTERFEMIPLIDWFTKVDDLIGGAGVSYLIRTDDTTILFDVGWNKQNEHPSPLLKNMEQLGISLDDIDIIVISHKHEDHVGGIQWAKKNTFSLTTNQIDLGQKKLFTPINMEYPDLKSIYSRGPVKIAKGVSTIGVIPCPLFFTDTGEQALAINVKDKGVVVITGCGHQTIKKLILRSELLFNQPVYALLGGFHLSITQGRNITKRYQYFMTSRLPWNPPSISYIHKNIEFLKTHNAQYVGISGHDSCNKSIKAFKEAYAGKYFDIAGGRKLA